MRKLMLTAAAVLLFTTSAFSADFVIPAQKIVGAESPIPLGELVDLSISPKIGRAHV